MGRDDPIAVVDHQRSPNESIHIRGGCAGRAHELVAIECTTFQDRVEGSAGDQGCYVRALNIIDQWVSRVGVHTCEDAKH